MDAQKNNHSAHVLISDCETRHQEMTRQQKNNARRVWWLPTILVGLFALMLAAIGQGWSAVNRADVVETKLEAQGSYLKEALDEIKTDVREIRAEQQRATRRSEP